MMSRPLAAAWRASYSVRVPAPTWARSRPMGRWPEGIWAALVSLGAAVALWLTTRFVLEGVSLVAVASTLGLGLATMVRVLVLIALASVIWVPLGVGVGLRPALARIVQPCAQFMAAFPANLLFPVAVSGIVAFRLDPDIWLSPLMILGTQWYILFNVIAGASALPSELRDVGTNLRVGGWLWWRTIALPGVFPYYVTGAITASGGSWNASIVAELASWGDQRLQAHGLGAYIARADRGRRFSPGRARHRGDEPLRRGHQPSVLASALPACGTQVPVGLTPWGSRARLPRPLLGRSR